MFRADSVEVQLGIDGWTIDNASHGTPIDAGLGNPMAHYVDIPLDTEVTITFADDMANAGSITFTASADAATVSRYDSPRVAANGT